MSKDGGATQNRGAKSLRDVMTTSPLFAFLDKKARKYVTHKENGMSLSLTYQTNGMLNQFNANKCDDIYKKLSVCDGRQKENRTGITYQLGLIPSDVRLMDD